MNVAIIQHKAYIFPSYTYGRHICTLKIFICHRFGMVYAILPPSQLSFDIYLLIQHLNFHLFFIDSTSLCWNIQW